MLSFKSIPLSSKLRGTILAYIFTESTSADKVSKLLQLENHIASGGPQVRHYGCEKTCRGWCLDLPLQPRSEGYAIHD